MALFKSLHYSELMLHMPAIIIESNAMGAKSINIVEGRKIHFQNYVYFTENKDEIAFLRKHPFNNEQYVEVEYNKYLDPPPEQKVVEERIVSYNNRNDVIVELAKCGMTPEEMQKHSIEDLISIAESQYKIKFVKNINDDEDIVIVEE